MRGEIGGRYAAGATAAGARRSPPRSGIIAYRQSVRWWLVAAVVADAPAVEPGPRRVNRRAPPPPIDIVVPVYNAPDDVRRCVASVLAHAGGDLPADR